MNDQELEHLAERAAHCAVKETFALIDVDIENMESLKSFRQDLQFANNARKFAGRSILAFATLIAGGMGVLIWEGIKEVLKRNGN